MYIRGQQLSIDSMGGSRRLQVGSPERVTDSRREEIRIRRVTSPAGKAQDALPPANVYDQGTEYSYRFLYTLREKWVACKIRFPSYDRITFPLNISYRAYRERKNPTAFFLTGGLFLSQFLRKIFIATLLPSNTAAKLSMKPLRKTRLSPSRWT